MRRRELLTGSAALALSAGTAHAFGISELGAGFGDLGVLGGAGIPSWVNSLGPILPDIAINWTLSAGVWRKGHPGLITPTALGITTSRASNATNLLPTSPSGFAYSTFGSGVTVQTLLGRQTYQAATNLFLNSTAPVTQTITLSATGSYTLWVNGPGSATIAAGTATITGAGTATNGSPATINCTVAGTVVVAISGSLQAAQLEVGTFGTPFIVTAGSSAARLADVTTMPVTVGSAYTLFEQAIFQAPIGIGVNQGILTLSDGTTTNRAGGFRASGGTLQCVTTTAGVVQSAVGITAVTVQTSQNNWAASFGTIITQSLNGTLATASSTVSLPSAAITTLDFGTLGTAASFFDGLATIDAIWLTQAIPNSQLQAMT